MTTSETTSFLPRVRRDASATAETASEPYYQVICVCGGCGFPVSGSAMRMTNVGKALQSAGIGYRVLHCAPSPIPLNTERSGVYRGVPFEYTTWLTRPANRFVRMPVYVRALWGLAWRLWKVRRKRRRTAVYLFMMEGPLVLCTGILCRVLGIPLVQEMNEWYPCHPDNTPFRRWLYRKPIFALATGILAISRLIERLVEERRRTLNPRLLIHWTPSMVDCERFVLSRAAGAVSQDPPYFLWCGVGYPDDVRFIIRVLAIVLRDGYPCTLRIVSAAYHSWDPAEMLAYAAKYDVAREAIDFVGCVDDPTLETLYKSAAGLLLPLWDDERSRTRVPNKLAEYLASGRPVITCAVGDPLEFLVNGVNAYVGPAADERRFADNMIAVMSDPSKATQIGANGQATCVQRLDYRAQAEGLARFFIDCIERRPATREAETSA